MTVAEYMKLKNGTDVRGIASAGVKDQPITLTEEAAANIAKAFCVWLISHTGKTKVCVAVGYDSRISSPALCEAVVNGITSTGHDAVITGLSTTPSMFMLLKDEKRQAEKYCHGAIMITASHLPANRNGMKFFSPNGGLESSDVAELLEMAAEYRFATPNTLGERTEKSYLDEYAVALVEKVRSATGEETPLQGKRIIVDAGNGAGGFYATKVLIPLGADTAGSQFLEPDGTFPNHIPNPENAQAMESIRNATLTANADLGIIFDTDVDRVGAVDKNGEEINRNRLIALISAVLLKEKAGTIVTDSITSDGLTKFINTCGGKHHRFKRGYKNVINEALRLNQAGEYTPLAIETSGHAALMENYFLDDGAYLITRLLIAFANEAKEGRELTDLIADLETPEEAVEIRLNITNQEDFKALGNQVLKDFEQYATKTEYIEVVPNNYEGCRVNYAECHGDGWALLRMSLHDPILPINIESVCKGGVWKIEKDLYYFLKKYSCLDVTPLKEAIDAERQKIMNEIKTEYVNDPSCLSFIFQGEQYVRPQSKTVEEPKENEQLILPEAVAILVSEEDIPESEIVTATVIPEEEIETVTIVSEEDIPESEITTAVEIEEAPEAEQLTINQVETAE